SFAEYRSERIYEATNSSVVMLRDSEASGCANRMGQILRRVRLRMTSFRFAPAEVLRRHALRMTIGLRYRQARGYKQSNRLLIELAQAADPLDFPSPHIGRPARHRIGLVERGENLAVVDDLAGHLSHLVINCGGFLDLSRGIGELHCDRPQIRRRF